MMSIRSCDELDLLAMHPDYIANPLSWLGHIPFAAWLVKVVEPKQFVELGSYSGTSYFAFCQAIKNAALETQCVAIDTWEGDDHTGNYSAEIFQGFSQYNDAHFGGFSRYLRMRFDDALPLIEEGTVDLLHIDGLHTYEAVINDFTTWFSKMSERGVILFHDTAVDMDGFGVKKFWSEVCDLYPSYNFTHSNGLGILLVGDNYLRDDSLITAIKSIAPLSERLAERLWLQQIVNEQQHKLEAYESVTVPRLIAEKELSDGEQLWLRQVVKEKDIKLDELEVITIPGLHAEKEHIDAERRQVVSELSASNARLLASSAELQSIKSSTVWKILAKIATLKKTFFST
jgi:hypothetical protein